MLSSSIEVQAINSLGGNGVSASPISLHPYPDEATLPPVNWEPPRLLEPTSAGQSTEATSDEGTAPSLKSWPFPWKSVPPQPEATTSPAATGA